MMVTAKKPRFCLASLCRADQIEGCGTPMMLKPSNQFTVPLAAIPAKLSGMRLFCPVLILAATVGFSSPLNAADEAPQKGPQVSLEEGWNNPPPAARLRAYWWWLNSNVTKEAITHDLEEMKAKGFGGAVLFDAGGAEQLKNAQVPNGPAFFSAEWRELFKHTLHEANRLGLEMSLNIQSGWNLGGPTVTQDDAVKKLTWSSAEAQGPGPVSLKLPAPAANDKYYRDLYVLAWREPATPISGRQPLKNLALKTLQQKPAGKGTQWAILNSAPNTAPFLLDDEPSQPGEEDTRTADVVDLTKNLAADGTLTWENAPEGKWRILRMGSTLGNNRRVSTHSKGWEGYALDVLDEGAFRRYWDAVVEPLIADAGPLAGKTLRYLHTDSWEVGAFNWTPTLREEFRRRRGYDFLPWLPVFAGAIVESREQSNRFLRDFRRTMGDLAAEHYVHFSAWAARHGLGIHAEAGGPHWLPIDAQQCLGLDDMPMSEFWAASPHRPVDETRFFAKQPASAAHTMGRPLVAAEGFTTLGPHWQERLWNDLKPSFDKACTEGMNRLFWHAFVCSPKETGIPGQQYFAGTHFNPKVTWWKKSAPFLTYLNRCQFLLQQGLFVADALFYYDNDAPNFSQLRKSDPAKLGSGYDYDVISADALITRVSVKEGRLTLPDGMSYRVLVLPERTALSLPVLQKVSELVGAGATVIGPKPAVSTGLANFPKDDAEVKRIADELWNNSPEKNRVIAGKTARDVLLTQSVKPDFAFTGGDDKTSIDYIHRRADGTDLYFVASRGERPESVQAAFRISGKIPELWNAVTGEHHAAAAYQESDGCTTLPLDFPPFGSLFVIFRQPAGAAPSPGKANKRNFTAIQELNGPWTVKFDPLWGGPESADFSQLTSWTARPEPGIRFYSGTATYQQNFDLPATLAGKQLMLNLGDVRELAEVRLNGQSLGIVWAPPFRVDITPAVKPGANQLEIEVVNFWPNRIIGDAGLPPEQRLTKTNILTLTAETPLMDSGLLGPVKIETIE
jgi:hypothetical protein